LLVSSGRRLGVGGVGVEGEDGRHGSSQFNEWPPPNVDHGGPDRGAPAAGREGISARTWLRHGR
jgi:hypothetical protein